MRKMKISAVFLTVFLIATVLIDSSSSKSCEDKKCIVKEPEPCAKKQKFEDFKKRFKKTYESPEAEEVAMENLSENNAVIDEHNEKFRKGKVSFGCGINQNADQKPKDINEKINRLNPNMVGPNACQDSFSDADSSSNDSNHKHRRGKRAVTVSSRSTGKDWRYTLSDPRDQGDHCGSCWTFATVSILESYYFIKTNKTLKLSEQNLVDCCPYGCDGGLPSIAFDYIKSKGIASSSYSSYKGAVGKCLPSKKSPIILSRYKNVTSNDEYRLKNAIDLGPVIAAIDFSLDSFLFYKSGIYYDPQCSSELVNHAVVVTGYGTENGTDFWWIRNSWGTTWGINGYAKLARNKNNHCGVAKMTSYPVLK